MKTEHKLMSNALMCENLYKLSRQDKHNIVKELLKNDTQRALAKKLGIPHSTIHDWSSLRQDNKGEGIHVSLSLIYRKIENLDSKTITDWGRIEMIKDKCECLLRERDL